MRKSRVIGWMDRVGEIWFRWFRESLFLRGLTDASERLGKAFDRSRVAFLLRSVTEGERKREGGVIAEFWGRFLHGLLCTTTDTAGGALILYGSVGILGILLSGSGNGSFFISGGAILLGLPLLGERRSLGWCISRSLVLERLLFGFCGILGEELAMSERGERHYGGAILFGVLGGLGMRLFPWLIPVSVLLFCGWLVLGRLPELLLLGIGVGLPFLDASGHATVLLCSFAFLLELFWLKKLFRRRRFLEIGLTDPLVLLFAALFVISGTLGAGQDSFVCGIARGGLVLAFFPAVSLLSRPFWRSRFLDGVQIGGGICSAVGIAQYFFTDLELRWVDKRMFGDLAGRVCALFSNPNVLASFLLLLLPLAMAGCMEKGISIRRRLLYGGALFLEGICLILTWCRGAWLGALGAGVFLLLFYHRRSAGAFFFGVIPLGALCRYLPGQVRRRFLSIGGVADSSVRYRYALWEGVRRMRTAHPWGIGVGESSFRRIYPDFAVSGTETVMHAHLLFGQVGVELGWLGACVLVLLLLSLVLETACRWGEQEEGQRRLCITLLACILGALIMGFFDYVWYHYGVFTLFWLLCACLCATAREGEGRNGAKE